jgi:hypothetical protein
MEEKGKEGEDCAVRENNGINLSSREGERGLRRVKK